MWQAQINWFRQSIVLVKKAFEWVYEMVFLIDNKEALSSYVSNLHIHLLKSDTWLQDLTDFILKHPFKERTAVLKSVTYYEKSIAAAVKTLPSDSFN